MEWSSLNRPQLVSVLFALFILFPIWAGVNHAITSMRWLFFIKSIPFHSPLVVRSPWGCMFYSAHLFLWNPASYFLLFSLRSPDNFPASLQKMVTKDLCSKKGSVCMGLCFTWIQSESSLRPTTFPSPNTIFLNSSVSKSLFFYFLMLYF